MRNYPLKIADLVFPNATAVSNGIDLGKTRYRGLAIFAPATLTGTITVEVSADGGSSYQTLRSGGADVEIAIDECIVIDYVGYEFIRLASSGSEGAERTFPIRATEEF